MVLADIMPEAISVDGPIVVSVHGIAYDSRKVAKGDVFIAVRGEKTDGHKFIGDAVRRGACAVVFESGSKITEDRTAREGVTWIEVRDSRDALACLAHRYFQMPSEGMDVIAVTGTNGKTTTTYLLKSILESWGKKVGLIGTIAYLVDADAYEAPHTTPEAPEFQKLLRKMADSRCSHVVTEVSSHALAQRRVDYTRFRMGIFTNLTRDHLDYHTSLESYFAAKERLFTELIPDSGAAVVNVDDPYGLRLAAALKDMGRQVVSYGLKDVNASVKAGEINCSADGTSFLLRRNDGEDVPVFTPLLGCVNVYNALAASGAALALGVPVSCVVKGIEKASAVKGRFEMIPSNLGFLAVVDYAHTEDALERAIMTAREMAGTIGPGGASFGNADALAGEERNIPVRGRVITVFGCGGDRDKGKRAAMGEVASRLSDLCVITSDNPRSEDPREIIRDIERGLTGTNYLIIADRGTAIRTAVSLAGPRDVLLVAGKGHEEYQEIHGRRYPFSDRRVLEEAMKGRKR